MPAAGRKPLPNVVHVLQGNKSKKSQKDLNADDTPKPKAALPPPPEHLTAKAREHWDKIGPQLFRMGVLTNMDSIALERLCTTYSDLMDTRQLLEDTGGWTIWAEGTNGQSILKANPAGDKVLKLEMHLLKYLTEFGMTPSARTRVKKAEGAQGEEGDDIFD